MKPFAYALATLAICGGTLTAQVTARSYSRPVEPARDALDRLNLQTAWSTVVPVAGKKDGLFSVQVLPEQIIVQSQSGGVIALDPATGYTLWRARIGFPYRGLYPVGYNAKSIFAVNGVQMYGLDRKTGQLQWELTPKNPPGAAPIADEARLYVVTTEGLLEAYILPPSSSTVTAKTPAASGTETANSETNPAPGQPKDSFIIPEYAWGYRGAGQIEQSPVQIPDGVFVSDSSGESVMLFKDVGTVAFRFQSDSPLAAPLGQYEDTVVAVTADSQIHTFQLPRQFVGGKLLWRFVAGSPVTQRPALTDDDVYVATTATGLLRLNRGKDEQDSSKGDQVWRTEGVVRFIAANPSVVYGADGSGRLVILDRARGTILGRLDTSAFVVPVANDITDRIYLAANDGTIVCLHDRHYPKPVAVRKNEKVLQRTISEIEAPAKKAEVKKEEEKMEDK